MAKYSVGAIVALLFIQSAIAEDKSHCVTGKDSYGNATTQCDDGSVTITTKKKVIVCGQALNGNVNCKEIDI